MTYKTRNQIKRLMLRASYFVVLFLVFSFLFAPQLLADHEPEHTFGTGAEGLVPCGWAGNPCTPCHLWVLANRIINFLLFILALPIMVVILLVGGILLLTSSGNPTQITKGRNLITKSVMGLLIAFGAWLIVNTIINTLAAGKITAAWNTISTCPASATPPPVTAKKYYCNESNKCVEGTTGPYTDSNCGGVCSANAFKCSASTVSPLVTAIIQRVIPAAQTAGVPVRTPTANQIGQGEHTCNLTATPPNISCHYGGRLCNGTANAVDFSLASNQTPQNWQKLLSVVQQEGNASARCEIGQYPYIVPCTDPRVNHIHVNASASCGCN